MTSLTAQAESVLIIACGALAHEIQHFRVLNGWSHVKIQCLDAELHNHPEQIPAKLQATIDRYRGQFEQVFVAYADCGTGGRIDQIIAAEGLERLPGAHCYAFFTGLEAFDELAEQELGSFYLTDFLARHFDRLIIKGLKLDKHPELTGMFFGNYQRLVYLSQTHDPQLLEAAEDAARYLGLVFKHVHTGYGELETSLNVQSIKWRSRP